MLTIWGHDPGSTNYGYSIISFRENPKNKKDIQFKLHEIGVMKNTLSTLNLDHRQQLNKYEKELNDVLSKYKINGVIAERFMIRSFRTATAEYVCFMLGLLFKVVNDKGLEIKYTPAVSWKNAVNKLFSLDEFYKSVKAEKHEIDATLMAFYSVNCLHILKTKKKRNELKCKLEQKSVKAKKATRKKKG